MATDSPRPLAKSDLTHLHYRAIVHRHADNPTSLARLHCAVAVARARGASWRQIATVIGWSYRKTYETFADPEPAVRLAYSSTA